MDSTPIGNTDYVKPQKQSKLSTTKEVESSVKAKDDKVSFKVETFFVDDY
jgi:hypothetical protein